MKKLIFCGILLISLSSFAQEKLLSMKIVYNVPITQNHIKSSTKADSIIYDYTVNRRFFWETMDVLMSDIKSKKLYLHSFSGDTITYDSMITSLTKQLNKKFLKNFSKKEIQDVLDNEIRSIQFQEQWTYNPQTMLINKKVVAYCPIIERDSVALVGEDLTTKPCFSFPIGWIYPKGDIKTNDTILICRNIQYNVPIYNSTPYHWWDNNLEPEYSLPFFSSIIDKAEKGEINVFEDPNSSEAFTRPMVLKRREFQTLETLIKSDKNNNEQSIDTTLTVHYNSENIDHIRFGEEIYFDKVNYNFIKSTNYLAPIISIYGKNGDFHGFYPMYYIRKKQ
jgi:hypothetical protein